MDTDESKTRAELLKELKESRLRLEQAEALEKDLRREVEKRKRLEKALQKSENKFKAITLSCPDHILMQDKNLRYTFVLNPQLGLKVEEMIGKTDKDFLSESDAAELTRIKEKVLKEGKPESTCVPLISMTGEMQYFEGSYIPIRDKLGRVDGLAGYFRNVTWRKKTEETIRIYTQRLSQAQENAHLGNWDWDLATDTLWWSAENYRIFGLDPQKVSPSIEGFLAAVEPAELESVKRAIEDALNNRKHYDIDMGIIRPDGVKRVVNAKARVIFNDSGKAVMMMGTVQDVTERKKAENQLSAQYAILNGILEGAGSPIFSVDRAYRYTSFNSSHAAIMKSLYGADIEIGKSLLDYHTVDRDREQARKNIDRAFNGEKVALESWTGESEALRRYFKINHTPIKDRDGQITGVAIFADDLTMRKKSEESLRQSEEQYRTLFEKSINAIFLVDSKTGRYLNANKAAEELTGRTLENLRQLTTRDVTPSGFDSRLQAIRKTRESQSLGEVEYIRPDGSKRNAILNMVPIGKNLVYGMSLDITERKKMENALQESEHKYRSLFEGMINGFALHKLVCDDSGKPVDYLTLEVNTAYERLLNVSKEAVIGKRAFEAVPNLDKEWLAIFSSVVLTGEPKYYVQYASNLNKWFEGIAYKVQKDQFAVTFMDITERKIAEEKLDHAWQQLELILGSAAEGILGLDTQGNHTFVNSAAARMLGWKVEELLGRPSHITWHHTQPDGSPYLQEKCEIYAAFRDGRVHRNSTEFLYRKEGSYFPVEYTSSPLLKHGEIVGAVVTFTDITERQKAEEERQEHLEKLEQSYQKEKHLRQELQEEARARGMFTEILGHEFRTPLTPLVACAGMLQEIADTQDRGIEKRLVKTISLSAQSLALRLEELLDLAKYSRGTFTLHKQPLNLSDLVNKTALLYQPLAQQQGKHLVLDMPDALPEIEADPTRLEQVLVNLLSNALKYSPQDTRITLKARKTGSSIILEVQDEGIGVSPEEQKQIFNPYHRVQQDTQKYPGIGLGLAVSRQIVEAHGGKIHLESQLGQGSAFIIQLPLKSGPGGDK